jgi:acetylglutamate kinase
MTFAPDAVSRFLWSIGQRAESEFYLALFRAEAKERFAAIAVDGPVIREALDALLVDLRFLADLGLTPTVVVGLFEGEEADAQAEAIASGLAEADVPAAVAQAEEGEGPTFAARVRGLARGGRIPVVALGARAGASFAERLAHAGGLFTELGTRKLIFLQRRGGIALEGQPVGIVELNGDRDALRASGELSGKQKAILDGVAHLLDVLPHRCTFAITSPLDLLRELFTTSGAGTLVRRAARIERHTDYRAIDQSRLRVLLESAFNKPLHPSFFARAVSRIYLEENYRGAAMVVETNLGAYMSKFAVERQAQGEGIGKDVWAALVVDYPTVFWRSRATNPVNAWYTKQCDGMLRTPPWQVFWRGVAPQRLPEAIAFALDQPKDFPRT